ncbi:MAG: alpha-amylase, partial [Gemmatimonadetes bacterium]|nr:alpha-amylase [Gemmatimonadota bacterium]
DARKVTVWGDLAEIDYTDRPARAEIVDYWKELASYYTAIGFHGFRCDAAYKVPAEVWAEIVSAARATRDDVIFCAETLGCKLEEVTALHDAGFDYLFNSAKWWDFKAPWLL